MSTTFIVFWSRFLFSKRFLFKKNVGKVQSGKQIEDFTASLKRRVSAKLN